jgi:hypothetical protein
MSSDPDPGITKHSKSVEHLISVQTQNSKNDGGYEKEDEAGLHLCAEVSGESPDHQNPYRWL